MIFYFSATGNCRHVARRIAAATGDQAVSVEAVKDGSTYELELKAGEMLAIVSPVYCGGLPKIVCDFLDKLRIKSPAEYV